MSNLRVLFNRDKKYQNQTIEMLNNPKLNVNLPMEYLIEHAHIIYEQSMAYLKEKQEEKWEENFENFKKRNPYYVAVEAEKTAHRILEKEIIDYAKRLDDEAFARERDLFILNRARILKEVHHENKIQQYALKLERESQTSYENIVWKRADQQKEQEDCFLKKTIENSIKQNNFYHYKEFREKSYSFLADKLNKPKEYIVRYFSQSAEKEYESYLIDEELRRQSKPIQSYFRSILEKEKNERTQKIQDQARSALSQYEDEAPLKYFIDLAREEYNESVSLSDDTSIDGSRSIYLNPARDKILGNLTVQEKLQEIKKYPDFTNQVYQSCKHKILAPLIKKDSVIISRNYILSILNYIENNKWRTGRFGFGGSKIKSRTGRSMTVPKHVKEIYNHCATAIDDQNWFEHFSSIAKIAKKASHTHGFFRDSSTQCFYDKINKINPLDLDDIIFEHTDLDCLKNPNMKSFK